MSQYREDRPKYEDITWLQLRRTIFTPLTIAIAKRPSDRVFEQDVISYRPCVYPVTISRWLFAAFHVAVQSELPKYDS
jgi:hypothetical protein